MPDAAMASACWRTRASLMSQLNLFHEFQPIGGVRASCGFGASSFSVSWPKAGAASAASRIAAASHGEARPVLAKRVRGGSRNASMRGLEDDDCLKERGHGQSHGLGGRERRQGGAAVHALVACDQLL